MIELSNIHKKVLDIYHNEGHIKAWNYWKLMGNAYGIFLGEVPSGQFIDGESLANHIGLTEGVICNNDTPWLKFILDSNMVYVPMKPLIHSVSWDAINECGAVFVNEGATIDIGGNTYDVTLLRGSSINDPNDQYFGFDTTVTVDSEWNRLMYPIHRGFHTGFRNPSNPSIPYAQWASYSDYDLIVDYRVGNGSASWMQELHATTTQRLYRGDYGVSGVNRVTATNTSANFGWRPALRAINNA